MKKLIILDYGKGAVTVMASGRNPNRTFEKWCEKNNVRSSDCYWMSWSGKIKHEK